MGVSVPECRFFYLPVSHVTHENIRFRNAIGGMFRIDEGCPVVPVFSGRLLAVFSGGGRLACSGGGLPQTMLTGSLLQRSVFCYPVFR